MVLRRRAAARSCCSEPPPLLLSLYTHIYKYKYACALLVTNPVRARCSLQKMTLALLQVLRLSVGHDCRVMPTLLCCD